MSEKKKEKGKEGKFAEFVSSAIRAPRQGVYEHLLSQFLASAVVVSDPLKRIKIVSEACWMIPEQERQDLAIEYETVERLNHVCLALQNAQNEKLLWYEGKRMVDPLTYVIIPWGFPYTEKNFEKYITPWYRNSLRHYYLLLDEDHLVWHTIWICQNCKARIGMDENQPTKCPKCGEKLDGSWSYLSSKEYEIIEDPKWNWFFAASRCLSVTGYLQMRNEFVSHAIPKVQLMLAELTRLVQPSLYANILGLYSKKRSYSEKVAEVAKGTTQTEEPPDRR